VEPRRGGSNIDPLQQPLSTVPRLLFNNNSVITATKLLKKLFLLIVKIGYQQNLGWYDIC
jgi:hypothetical protein